MDVFIETLINIAIYIFIFKMIFGAFSKKEPPKKEKGKPEVPVENKKNKKKSKSLFEEALEQIKKLEELSQDPGKIKKKKKYKSVSKTNESHLKTEPVKYKGEEIVKPAVIEKKQIDENNEEIYYNNEESVYSLKKEDLKKAIVYSEIIGKPVSKRTKMPYRR